MPSKCGEGHFMKIAGPLQGVSRSEEHQGGGPLAWSLRVIGFEGNNVWLS